MKLWRLTPCPKDHKLESCRKEIAPQPLSKIKQSNLQLKDCGFSESKRIVTINSHKSGNSPNPLFSLSLYFQKCSSDRDRKAAVSVPAVGRKT